MEAKLLELFPDETIPVAQYRSFVNQPERIQISSQEDLQDYDPATLTSYYNFKVRLPRPALDVKSLQLARASIPNAVPNIPDTECTFWYYALPTVSPGNIYENNAGVPGNLAYTFDISGVLKTPGNVIVRSGSLYENVDGSVGNLLYTFDLNGVVSDMNGVVAGASINFTTGTVIIPAVAPITISQTTYDTTLEYVNPPASIPCVNGSNIVYFLVFDSNAVYFDSGNFRIGIHNYLYNITTAKPGNVAVACIENGDTDYWIVYTSPQRANVKSNYLRYIRLCPSNAQPELMDGFAGGFNRSFVDYDDLVSELNNSTVDDPLNGEQSNEILGTFKFKANQVAFSYSTRFNKIVFTGLDPLYSYCPAASDDPIWFTAAAELQQRDRENTRFILSGAVQIIQPFILYRDLNLRLGFTYAIYPSGDNFLNMLRPIPPYINSTPSLQDFTIYDHVAPGYADLVYSSCCHIYCDVTGGSTVDSIVNKALLASIPINTPNLGVGFHSLPLSNPLTKISSEIYEIYIELRTDTGQPFYLGNNAIVSLELILTY